MKTRSRLSVAALLAAALMLTFCQKDEDGELVSMVEADDEVAAFFDETLVEADDITNSTAKSLNIGMYSTPSSGSRNFTTRFSGDTAIHTIVYDQFVNANSPFQRVKHGTITVKVVGLPLQAKFWRQITFSNFTVNEHKVEGTQVVEKVGSYQFSVSLTGGKITFKNGATYTRDYERTRTWTVGYATPLNIWDDEFSIEGEASGINLRGMSYKHTITSPLLVRFSCRWIAQGMVEFTVGNGKATLNYGDGTCDSEATVSANGQTWSITLK